MRTQGSSHSRGECDDRIGIPNTTAIYADVTPRKERERLEYLK